MKKTFKKTMAILLVAMMLVTMLPLTAFAAEISETDVSLSDVSVVETSEADTVVEDVETVNSIEEINEEEPEEEIPNLNNEENSFIPEDADCDIEILSSDVDLNQTINDEKEGSLDIVNGVITTKDEISRICANEISFADKLTEIKNLKTDTSKIIRSLGEENGYEVSSMILDYIDVLEKEYTNRNIEKDGMLSDDFYKKCLARQKNVKDYSERIEWKYVNAYTNFMINDISEGGNTIELYEWTFIEYTDKGYSDLYGFGLNHVLNLSNGRIVSDTIENDDFDDAVVAEVDTSNNQQLTATEPIEIHNAPEQPLKVTYTYNASAAVAYAEKYWQNYNDTEYYNFNLIKGSGDCANFVSQCLYAGGIPMVKGSQYGTNGWFYYSSTNRSGTWTFALYNYNWFKDYGKAISSPSESQVLLGNPVYYDTNGNGDINHVAICCGKNSAGTPVVAAHNSNHWNSNWKLGYAVSKISTIQLNSSNSVTSYSITDPSTYPSYPGSYMSQSHNNKDYYNVRFVQLALNDLMNAGLDTDGSFGPATAAAVKNFQTKYGLNPDSDIDGSDWAKILELLNAKYGNVAHTFKYNANGGSGSMSSVSVKRNGTIPIGPNKFYRNGYVLKGWNVHCAYDNTWYVVGEGWLTEATIKTRGLSKKLYPDDSTCTLDNSWLQTTHTVPSSTTFTFYAVWERAPFIPKKTIYYNGSVYSLYDESLSWLAAEKICEAVGGHLVTITSAGETETISNLIEGQSKDNYWIGLSDEANEGTWQWVTGEKYSYNNWREGEPSDTSGKENYVEIYNEKYDLGTWNDNDCSPLTGGFICEIETSTLSPAATMTYDGKKYELYENRLAWNDAKAFAESKGGHLATTEDTNENKAISDFAAANGSQYRYWLGGTDYGKSSYEWVTGEPFNYSNWAVDEPTHTDKVEYYIQMYNNEPEFANGTWNDYRQLGYSDAGNGFIVEYPVSEYTIAYDANGGYNAPGSHIKVPGKSVSISSDKPIYDAYSFVSWNTKADGSGISYAPGDTYILDADLTLYAQWVYTGYKGKCGDDLEWSFNDGLLKITGTGAMYDYDSHESTPWYSVMSDIEEVWFGNGITHIGAYAFYKDSGIEKITIPSSVISIGDYAFHHSEYSLPDESSVYIEDISAWCNIEFAGGVSSNPLGDLYINNELVEYLDISDDVTSISACAFAECTSLKNVRIPDSVRDIGVGAFSSCVNLELVEFGKNISSIPEYCFLMDEIKRVIVPDTITAIAENAFFGIDFTMYGYADSYAETYAAQYDNITFVDVEKAFPFTATPDSVSPGGTIELTAQGGEEYRFYGGYNGNWSEYLQDFSSDNTCSFENTDSTGEYKFYCDIEVDDGFVITREVSCNVTLPTSGKCGDNLTWSYSYDNNTLSITGTGKMYDYGYTDDTMAPWSKYGGDVWDVSFGKGITHIGAYAFSSCYNIHSVDIPEGVVSIGDSALNCYELSSIHIPKTLRNVGAWAFYNGSIGEMNVYITDLTAWCKIIYVDNGSSPLCSGGNLFLNDELIEELIVPNGITRINDYSFSGCLSLKKVILPNTVTEIGQNAFSGSAVTEIELPSNLLRISDEAFWDCPLKKIEIPQSVTYIGETAFAGCRALKEIRIPDSVTEIGAAAFAGCSNLEHVVLSKNMQIIPAECFASASELKTVFVPESITAIEELAFDECGDFTMYGYAGSYAETYAALYDNITFIDVNTAMPFMASPADSSEIGSTVTLSAMGGEKYKFYYECSGSWVRLSDFNSGNTYEWKPSKVGKYNLYCDIKTADGAVICKIMPYEVKEVSVNFTAAPESETKEGTSVTLSASGGISYKFYYYFEGVWVTLKDYGKANTYEWTPTEAGEYTLYADIMSSDGDIISRSIQYTVVEGTSFKVTPTTTIQAGNEVTLSASGGISYKFYYSLGSSWVRIRDFEKSGTCKWTPTKAGSYALYCDIMDSNGDTVCRTIDYTVTEPEKFTANLKFAYVSPQKAGTTIKLTASATGGKGALKYKFYSECNGVWTKLWDYDTRDTYNWHATTVGTHTVYCDVMDEEGNVACAVVEYQIVAGEDFVADLNANRISGQLVGTEIRLLGGSSNGTGAVKYKFYYEVDGNWVRLSDFTTQDYFLWTPTKAGYYNLYMDAQDSAGHTASKRLCITIDEGQTLKVTSVTFNPTTGKTGTSTTITAKSTGGSGTVTYKFYYEMNGAWVKLQDFSTAKTCSWKPTKTGTYHIYVDAIDGTKNTQCLMVNYVVK